jgi:hypothetical protein
LKTRSTWWHSDAQFHGLRSRIENQLDTGGGLSAHDKAIGGCGEQEAQDGYQGVNSHFTGLQRRAYDPKTFGITIL